MRFEFKLTENANNGIGIRAPLEGDAAYVGMEIQVLDDGGSQYTTCSPISTTARSTTVAAEARLQKPVGEWNAEEITANGRQITVKLNGTTIVDANLDDIKDEEMLKKHPASGLKSRGIQHEGPHRLPRPRHARGVPEHPHQGADRRREKIAHYRVSDLPGTGHHRSSPGRRRGSSRVANTAGDLPSNAPCRCPAVSSRQPSPRRSPVRSRRAARRGAEITRPDDRFLRTRLNALLDVTAVPGFAVGVMRDGKLTWERYQGVMEAGTRRPIDADTLFPAASLGKPVFAYAALRLADQGRPISIDR